MRKFFRWLFKRCPECGAKMNTRSQVAYVAPAYCADPPYKGIIKSIVRKCQNPICGRKLEYEGFLPDH